MKRSYVFPSVYEETSVDFTKVAGNFIEGMKINNFNQRNYLIGNLALIEGNSPHKFLNSSAQDLDYQLMALAALIISSQGTEDKMVITTGFPFITHKIYKKGAKDFYFGNHQFSFDTRTFGGAGDETINVNVSAVDVMTEIDGCIKAIRYGKMAETQNFFIGNLGFGTFELALSTPSGIVQRTADSVKGISYAVNILENEIEKQYILDMLTGQQIERAFQRGFFLINRQRVDVLDMRKRALISYYNEVISPAMRKKFSDEDFSRTNKIYLVGGGAMYSELGALFKEEFQDILEVIVYPEPYLCASEGYCLNSASLAPATNSMEIRENITYVGIDLGNSNTVVTIYNDTE